MLYEYVMPMNKANSGGSEYSGSGFSDLQKRINFILSLSIRTEKFPQMGYGKLFFLVKFLCVLIHAQRYD